MGRRGRRTVLQLGGDNDGFLAKYGYNRQEEEIPGGHEESDEEQEEEVKTPPMEVIKPKENGDHIDNQVASFLAQLEHDDGSNDSDKPSFATDQDIQPGFKLNPDQKSGYSKEPEPPTYVSNKARSMYKNMFVKGDVEFAGKSDKGKSASQREPEIEWPEEPVTVWQQTLDDNTQCYYYWNTVSNEVTWEIPPDFTQYLLQMKSYEEKVAKLQKEGKVKPEKKVSEKKRMPFEEIAMPPTEAPSPSATFKTKEPTKPESDLKEETKPAEIKSTASSKKTLVAAAYFDSDADSSGSESDSGDDKKKKKKKSSDEDVDLDLDDIDKALEVALEKKKTKSEKESSEKSSSKSKSDAKPKVPKKLTLIDSIKEQVQRKMEVEARRKAAIEEMMARELERRVGPPRKRSSEDETVWDSKRPKIVDYGHSRSRSPVNETVSRDDRDSRRRHESHRDKDSDRHSHKEKKKKKDKDKDKDREDYRHRDEKRRDHDKHDKDHKDRKKDKKKDKEEKRREKDDRRDKEDRKDRDEKKEKDRDKEKDKERDRKKDKHEEKEKKTDEQDQDKSDKKKTDEKKEKIEEKTEDIKEEKEDVEEEPKKEEVVEVKQEPEEKRTKKTLDMDIDAELETIVTGAVKVDVELANKKMQASELADLALSKLEFLEVTKKGLSKLQILLVELETRHQDWQAGGLNTEFYLVKLEEANWQLEQYERSAAPPGWSCHWDRSYRRYFYMNKKSKQTQWDYPDEEDEEEEEPSREASPEREVTHVSKEPVVTSNVETEIVSSTTPEQEEVTTTKSIVSSAEISQEESTAQPQAEGWPDYEAVTNYISGAEYSGVIRGEPPPPGTDLEYLLTAPPPPPPPMEEQMEEEAYPSYDVPGPPESATVTKQEADEDIDGTEMENGSDYGSHSDIVQSETDVVNEQYKDSETDTVSVDPSIIARPPQIFTENPYASYYEPNAEQYQDPSQNYSESGADMSVPMETTAVGDSAIQQQEKEKKKKKKDKQSSGQLKNKNVSNLVQKWQKVKKEVEIEEQEREERQQAIRQKLDEWKKEHS